jgi:hypothetical protein
MRIDAAEKPEFWGCFSLLGDLAVPFSILANGFAIDHQANGIDKNQDNRSDSQEEAKPGRSQTRKKPNLILTSLGRDMLWPHTRGSC